MRRQKRQLLLTHLRIPLAEIAPFIATAPRFGDSQGVKRESTVGKGDCHNRRGRILLYPSTVR